MRHLLILTCLLFGTGATAEEGDFDFNGLIAKKALRDYKKAVAKDEKATELKRKELDEEAANAAKTTRDAFVENLTKALKQSMQAGNLEEANKIDAAIKALKKGVTSGRNSVDRGLNQNEGLLPDGIYRAYFGNEVCTHEYRKKGHILTWVGQVCESGRFEPLSVRGVIKQVGNNVFEITFDGGRWFARWWVYDQHILVEWWDYHNPWQQKDLKQPWFIAVIDRSKKR